MKTQVIDFDRPDLSPKNLALSLGGFEAIHRGHQSLIKQLVKTAKKKQIPSALGLFDPLPYQVLNHQKPFKRLFSLLELESLLKPFGLDFFLIIPFTKDFSLWNPSDFILMFLIRHFKPLFLLLGYDFSYAYKKSGDFSTLQNYAKQGLFSVQRAPALLSKKVPISSSQVRKHLLKRDMQAVQFLLGRPYSVESKVLKGDGRGKKIGFPTANLKIQNKEYPPLGVYAGQAFLNGKSYKTVINIGHRPTFTKRDEIFVEAHILDFNQSIYDQVLRLEIQRFIRKERPFPNTEALREQIQQDIQNSFVMGSAQ